MSKYLALGIAALYLVLGTAYVFRTPAWQSPDEPAHYNYVRQLADGDAPFFPLMQPGDYDEAYQNATRDSCFAPQFSIEPYQYEDYQPPLYYITLLPAFLAFDGVLWAVRLTSVLLGAGIVWLAWKIGRAIFPGRDWIALSITAFVALVPQHIAILSSVNNDALAGLLVAGMIYGVVKSKKVESRKVKSGKVEEGVSSPSAPLRLTIILLLGLAFLTKVTAYLMAGAIGFVLLWQWWGDWRGLIKQCVRVFVPALAIGALWWGRNVFVYPGFDWLGTQAHDAIVQGQLTTADYIAQFGRADLLTRFRTTTFNSFFGQFGWMAAPFPAWMYRPLLVMVSVGVFGAVWRLARWRFTRTQLPVLLILGGMLGLNGLLYVVYNIQFVQHQGRYLFPSIIPIAVALVVGLKTVLGERIGRIVIPAGLIIGLLYLNYVALRFILPGLHYTNC